MHNEECLNEKINKALGYYSQCLDESMAPLGQFARGGSPSGRNMPGDCRNLAISSSRSGLSKSNWEGGTDWESKGLKKYEDRINTISEPYLESILKMNKQSVDSSRNYDKKARSYHGSFLSRPIRNFSNRLEAAVVDLSAFQLNDDASSYTKELKDLYLYLINQAIKDYKKSPVSERSKPREHLTEVFSNATSVFSRLRMYEEAKKFNKIKEEMFL